MWSYAHAWTIGGLIAAALLGCTDPPLEIAPEWRWDAPATQSVRSMTRLDDGGAILALTGDSWSIVRLSDAGEQRWTLELPWMDLQETRWPYADASVDDTFVVSYPTGEDTCRVLRVDDQGQEVAAFDYPFKCVWLTAMPDGGFAVGTRALLEPVAQDAVILDAEGAVRTEIVAGECNVAHPCVAANDGVFFCGATYECDESGDAILGTGRPWNGLYDGEDLVWERSGEDVRGLFLGSSIALTADETLVVDVDEDGHRSIRAFARDDGTPTWDDDSDGFEGIDTMDEGTFVALWRWIETFRLREYTVDGQLQAEWTIPLDFSFAHYVGAAPDRSVLVAFLRVDDLTWGVERYQLPER
jgi:hypothetical protein